MAGINKSAMDLITNVAIFGGIGLAAYYAYSQDMFGIQSLINKATGGGGGFPPIGGGGGGPPPPMQTPSTGPVPFSPTGSVPNPSGFETGYAPGNGPIPGGAPGINYQNAMYNSPFGTPAIDPQTGIDYSFYYPPTGVGTLPGTNPTPYPNPCLPGYYRASDLKCYPIPTQFPGNGCGTGMYLANDGRCYPYPGGPGGTGGVGAPGGGYAPVPCPAGEYRASDGKCYALPTPPPESCPTGAYRASDGKCYPITPGQPVGDCPAGYTKGSDGVCRASTACPAGYQYQNGVCMPTAITCPTGYTYTNGVCVQNVNNTCPTGYTYTNGVCMPSSCPAGYTLQNGMCVQNPAQCPAGYVVQGGVCVPAPNTSPLNIPIRQYSMIKELPPGVSPDSFSTSVLRVEPYKVDVKFWTAVISRPQVSPVPNYAVIIEAVDSSEYRDAMTRANFRALTPEDLMRYMNASGSFNVSAFAATLGRGTRRFNRRLRRSLR